MVMGHEMAHALLEHGRERAGQQKVAQAATIGASVLSQVMGYGDLGGMLASQTSKFTLLSFSRGDESDADLVGMSPELRSTMLDAYTRVVDGVRRPLRALDVIEEERMATIAGLLELGPRMGLHVSVAPALASTLVAGRTLGARTTVDPIDSSPPLRLRSDRDAYDAVDAVLYRRGRVLLFCEVVTGPLPIGELLLQRHALIASDREVVRLLVLAPALVPLLQLRLQI
jgi:hypothetical protein